MPYRKIFKISRIDIYILSVVKENVLEGYMG